MRMTRLLPILLLLCFAPVILAQGDCPAIVSAALQAVDQACALTERNQACYGNIVLEATPRQAVPDFSFEQAGDIAALSAIESLRLSSLSLTDATWGVALLRVQANLPDTLPGQNVTFLLFGDVQLRNAGGELVQLPVTAASGVNVRLRPTTNANNVIASLKPAQEVTATGRLADGSWVRVRLDDGSEGWVSADFLDGELRALQTVEPGALAYGPMQAFYFTTGLNDAPCSDAPDSGILIQTPEGAGTIHLRANEVDIQLGSTVYLQAAPGKAMAVSVIEGHAVLTAQGQSQIVPAGTVSTIPLDGGGLASGPPTYPQPYAYNRLRYLPVHTALFAPIEVKRATARPNIAQAIEALAPSRASVPGNGVAGNAPGQNSSSNAGSSGSATPPQGFVWIDTTTVTQNTCDPSTLPVGLVRTAYPTLIFSEDRSTLTFDWGGGASQTFYRTAENVYVVHNPVGFQAVWTITFTSPTTYTNVWRSNPEVGCVFWHDGVGVRTG